MKPELCETIRDLIPEYVDGEACAADADLVRAHLRACAGCRREAAEWRALGRLVDEGLAAVESVSEAEVEAAVARVSQERPLWQAAPAPLRFWRSWAPMAAMGTAAVLLVLLVNYTPGVASAGPMLRDWAFSLIASYPTDLPDVAVSDVIALGETVRALPDSTAGRVAQEWTRGVTFTEVLATRIGVLPLAAVAFVLFLANVAFVRAVRGTLRPTPGG